MLARRLLAAGSGGSFSPPEPPTYTAITILGDSISAAYGVSEPQRWGAVLDGMLSATVNIQATPGAQSSFFTTPANYTLGTPDLVFIECGVNDYANHVTKATFKANVLDIIADVRAALSPDPSFVIVISYEIGTDYAPPAWSEYCDAMEEIDAADGAVSTLDLRPIFGAPSTTLLQGDLVHPNPTGHVAIADAAYALLT